jgi:hypothetical protein
MKSPYFKEEQKFKQAWMWLIIIPSVVGTLVYFSFAFNKQIINGEPVGNNPISDTGLIILGSFTILLMLGLTMLFYKMRLKVEVDRTGIHFTYPPMILKNKSILKPEIESYIIREYNPIMEYGGWGVKQSSMKWGKAYNVSGNTGMQLYLKDGKKVLFGTQRPDAFEKAVARMMSTDTLN